MIGYRIIELQLGLIMICVAISVIRNAKSGVASY